MAIEFCCLNCRNPMVADDDEAGEKVECDNCSMLVKVPVPIGGALTDKRLRKHELPSVSVTVSSEEVDYEETKTSDKRARVAALYSERDQRYFDLRNQPHQGFKLKVELPDDESLTPEERESLTETADAIVAKLLAHLEYYPDTFQRGGLFLCLNHWHIDTHFRDMEVRLMGILNGKQVSESVRVQWQSGTSRGRSMFRIVNLLNMIFDLVRFLEVQLGRASYLRAINRSVSKKIVADLIEVLDTIAKRSVPLGTRMARGLRFDN